MKGNLKKIERQYDKIAGKWAETFSGEHEKKPLDREILKRFASLTRGRGPVWDLGCGPGNTTQYLTDLGIEISGLDLSEKMLEQARAIHPDIAFQKGNILDLPFEADSIAAIVAFYAIIHFTEEEVEKAFCEIFRVLKPGGLLLLTYHTGEGMIHLETFLGEKVDMDFIFFSTPFITQCLEKAGFKLMDLTEREPYEGIEYQSRRAYVFAEKPVRKNNR